LGMSHEHKAPRVLIVDDNLALAENIAEVLSMDGVQTDVAGSGEEALPKAAGDDLRVLLTDFRLPGLNGAELIDEVRRTRNDIHFIVMSGHTDEQTMSRAQAAGARFMAKPLDLGMLAQLVLGRESAT
jgi:DNA-binding response OmpR family regulator